MILEISGGVKMLESYVEQLDEKYSRSIIDIYVQFINQRDKIIRRDYTLMQRYFSGVVAQRKMENDANKKTFAIMDRYYQIMDSRMK